MWEEYFDSPLALAKNYVVNIWETRKLKLYGDDSSQSQFSTGDLGDVTGFEGHSGVGVCNWCICESCIRESCIGASMVYWHSLWIGTLEYQLNFGAHSFIIKDAILCMILCCIMCQMDSHAT